MTVIPTRLLLICLLHCFKYGCPETVEERDPTVVLSRSEANSVEYLSIIPFDDVLRLTLTPRLERCQIINKVCLCALAASAENIKPNNAAPCGPTDSALCVEWDGTDSRFAQVQFFTNSKEGSVYEKTSTLRKVTIDIPLIPDSSEKNVTTFKLKGEPHLPIATWANFMERDSDKYGMIRYIKLKVIDVQGSETCPIRVDLRNGAEWMPDVTALTPHVTKTTEEVEEEEETTTESVAAAGMMPKMRLHSWIVCIVGLVIWMIWTVVYIILLALAFNRRLCFVMMDPPEVVEDVQVYSSGKNP